MESNAFGRLVYKIRWDEMGLIQEHFASLIDVSRETVSRWEAGKLKTTPSPANLARLATVSGHIVPEFLIAIGFDLSPLIDDGNNTTLTERLALLRAASLSEFESGLISDVRRLPPVLQRVVERQIHAALVVTAGLPDANA